MGSATLSRYLGFLNTPPLWIKKQFGLEQFTFPELDPGSLKAETIPQGIRLGHQMEYVFRQCILQAKEYDLLVYNAPIRDSGKTLGEVDFILKDRTDNRHFHVELTFKFYIINPEISEPIHRLMGPNKRDMFFTKLDKIREEQLLLLKTARGKALLETYNLEKIEILPRVCFKAQLFVPYQTNKVHIRPLNKACVAGFWIRFETFKSSEFKNDLYYIPFKHEWPVKPNNNVTWISYYEALLEVNIRMIKEQAPLLWRKKSDTEFDKFFVVWW